MGTEADDEYHSSTVNSFGCTIIVSVDVALYIDELQRGRISNGNRAREQATIYPSILTGNICSSP